MATTGQYISDSSLLAGEDLSAKQFYAGRLKSDGTVELAITAGGRAYCVIGNAPTSGQAVEAHVGGVVKAKLGGTVAVDAALTPTTSGLLISTTTDTHHVFARALEAGVANDVIKIEITKEGRIASS